MRKIKEHTNNGGKCLMNFKHYLNIVTVFHTKTAALQYKTNDTIQQYNTTHMIQYNNTRQHT